jgi:hypothetical protein
VWRTFDVVNLANRMPVVTIETYNRQAEIDLWDDAIATLDQALADAASSRVAIESEQQTIERLEAGHVLTIEGGNAETRKARLTLALADDGRYQVHHQRLWEARQRLMDAERRVMVAKERCRLLRTSLLLQTADSQ